MLHLDCKTNQRLNNSTFFWLFKTDEFILLRDYKYSVIQKLLIVHFSSDFRMTGRFPCGKVFAMSSFRQEGGGVI